MRQDSRSRLFVTRSRTPQNASLIAIDYQPSQFATIRLIDQELLTMNIVSTVQV